MSPRLPLRQTTAQKRAKDLRSDLTPAEQLLWSVLRAHRLAGLKFRRQVSIGPYIADFYCAAAGLIVEADGESHEVRQSYDQQRTIDLESHGLRVIRVSNDDVMTNLEGVAFLILKAAGVDPQAWLESKTMIESRKQTPSP